MKCSFVRIRKVKSQLASVLGQADMIDGHLREIKHQPITFRRARRAQISQSRCKCIGRHGQQEGCPSHENFLQNTHKYSKLSILSVQ